jgi:UDP:flavonoid glycosyltransferase YjiC (YdhE family)
MGIDRVAGNTINEYWLSLFLEGIPWIQLQSMTPIGNNTDNVPPFASGLPTDGDRGEWERFRKKDRELMEPYFEEVKAWVLENGGPELVWHRPRLINDSPFANIYMYPLELDYTMHRPNPPNWYRFDTFVRSESNSETFEIPKEIQNRPGKLVYFSLGTIGSGDLVLMKRLIGFLGKSSHRFIVSKGKFQIIVSVVSQSRDLAFFSIQILGLKVLFPLLKILI